MLHSHINVLRNMSICQCKNQPFALKVPGELDYIIILMFVKSIRRFARDFLSQFCIPVSAILVCAKNR